MSSNEMVGFPRELSDELAELIAEKARVCGGGAFEIWEAICDQFGTQAQHQGDPVFMKPQYSSLPGLKIVCEEGEIGAEAFYRAPAEQSAPAATIARLMGAVHSIAGFPGVTGTQLHQLAERLRGKSAPVAMVMPELTDDLRYIFGLMCFQCITYAQALRGMGHTIANKAEDEQAATIHWLYGHYLRDPDNWRTNAITEIKAANLAAEQQ